MIKEGDPAPDFALEGTQGEFQLSAQWGRPVVLFFYPKDNTSGWIRQLSAARDAAERFQAQGVVRVGVNPGSLASHQKFDGLYDFGFQLLVDTDKQVAQSYGVLKENGGINRTVFLVDGAGFIRYRKTGAPTTDDILAALDTL